MRSTCLSFVPGLQGSSTASLVIPIDRASRQAGFSYSSSHHSPAYLTA